METRRRGGQERGPPLFHAKLQKSKRNVEHSIKVGGRPRNQRLHRLVKIHRDEAANGLGRQSDTVMTESAAGVEGATKAAAGVGRNEEGRTPNATTAKRIYGEK